MSIHQSQDLRPTLARRGPAAGLLAAGVLAVAAVVGAGAGRADAGPPAKAKVKHGALTVRGEAAADRIALRLAAGSPGTLEVDFSDDGTSEFSFDRARFDRIVVNAGAGNDLIRIDESNGDFADTEATTLNGDEDDDTLLGGAAIQTLSGDSGNDTVDGGRGNDLAVLGDGDDTFVWDPGDGSDQVDGDAGQDTMVFNGSAGSEQFQALADGSRLRFLRDLGTIVMDVAGTERVDLRALDGRDHLALADLSATELNSLDVDLEGVEGGGQSDGQQDTIEIAGTAAADSVEVAGDAGRVSVAGFAPRLAVAHSDIGDFSADRLAVRAGDGDDLLTAVGLSETVIGLELDGGSGADALTGGDGFETLTGGDGDDVVDGAKGVDLVSLGAGEDRFHLDSRDGFDRIEGDAGNDTVAYRGTGIRDFMELTPDGSRVQLEEFQGVFDLGGVERIDAELLGGGDVVDVDNLTGTDLTELNLGLNDEGGDGAADSVFLFGTLGSDDVQVTADRADVRVSGVAPSVRIADSEAGDALHIRGSFGTDTITAGPGLAPLIGLIMEGGLGDDLLSGGDGDDILRGEFGDDRLSGRDGDDLLDGGLDRDSLDGGPGADELIVCEREADSFVFDPADTITPRCLMA